MQYHRHVFAAGWAFVLVVICCGDLVGQQQLPLNYNQQPARTASPSLNPAYAPPARTPLRSNMMQADLRAAEAQRRNQAHNATPNQAPRYVPVAPQRGFFQPRMPPPSRDSGFTPLANPAPTVSPNQFQPQASNWNNTAPAPGAVPPVQPLTSPSAGNLAPGGPVGVPADVRPPQVQQPQFRQAQQQAQPPVAPSGATTPAGPSAQNPPAGSGAPPEDAEDEAGEAEPAAEDDGPTVEQVKGVIQGIESSESIEDEKKAEYTEYLNQAIKWLEATEESATKIAQYEGEVKAAPKLLEEAKKELDTKLLDPVPQIAPDVTLAQLEQGLSQAEEDLKSAQEELKKREDDVNAKSRTDRKAALGKAKDNAKQQLEETESELSGSVSADDSDSATAARQTELKARKKALEHQIRLIDAERSRWEALAEWFPVRRDLTQRRVTHTEKLLAAWQQTVTGFRKAESERQAAEARQIASQAHPALRELAERNAELAETRKTLSRNMEKVSADLESVRTLVTELDGDFTDVTDKVDVYGMTPTVGMLLRTRRDHLPAVTAHQERIDFSRSEMQIAQVALMELDDERAGDIEGNIEQAIEELGSVATQFEPGYLEDMVRQLLKSRRDFLDSLLLDYASYHDDLSNLELETGDLLDQVNTYRSYVDEHVLWIPSSQPIGKADVAASWHALLSFFDLGSWLEVVVSTLHNVTQNPLASLGLVLACVGLFVFRHRILTRLDQLGEQVERDTLSFVPTMWALALTVLLAALWPLMFWGIGWWIAQNPNAPDLALGLASGFKAIAVTYFVVELFRQVCRPGGLADRHFSWPKASVEAAYSSLNWLAILVLPILFTVSLFARHDGGAWEDSLGRFALLVGLGVLAAYLHQVLHPRKGAIPNALREATVAWVYQLRHVWYVLGVGTPIALAVLLAVGYSYSADQIMGRLGLVTGLFLTLLLAQELVSRALQVAWNRLRASRNADESERIEPEIPTEESTLQDVAAKEHEATFANVDQQLSQLVRGAAVLTFLVCNWFVWSDVLPALQILDRVELWNTTAMVSQEMQANDGTTVLKQVPKEVPVTLADLIVSMVALIVTYMAGKTLPGLLEISILGRLPMEAGARHATVIISRYAVSMVGFVLACQMMGIGWSSVQWLIAAMTVGLGFGLQEIFANLVSGLILLFERPIRIGDLVTVNGQTGKITRMQIRATTITDFDRRELIVPNKRFITDDVVNWTLSDPITRFVVPIGISYSCDPAEAQRLLLEIAARHPLVLDEPKPSAPFLAFGDSTLNLELRAFIGRRDDFVVALHEVNLAIKRSFDEAGIDIAFPQQEIHIRSLPDALQQATVEDDVPQAKAA